MNLNDSLTQAGFPYDEVLRRFSGNEMLLKKFLLKFPQDPTFAALAQQVQEQDYANIEKSAHTLKGVSANLGFNNLSAVCAEVVSAVRNQSYDTIASLFETVQKEYDTVLECIQNID